MTRITDNRAVSEAVSQALLFLYLVGLTMAISSGAAPIVDQLEAEETYKQNIEGIERINQIIYEYDSHSSVNEFATASKTARFNTIQSTVAPSDNTTITIDDGGERYQVNSTPIRFTHPDYTLTFDSGITQYTADRTETTYEIPSERSQLADNDLLLLTTSVSPDITSTTTRDHTVIISTTSPERGVLNEGGSNSTEITVSTEQQAGWESYLEEIETIESVSSTTISENRVEVTATVADETTIFYQQINIK